MSQIIINEKSFSGRNVIINNNKVIVDGIDVTPDTKEINISVEGNINELTVDVCKTININGNVYELQTTSGDVQCNDVNNGIKTTSGDVECNNVTGNIQTTSGDVTANEINGSVKTVSGDIKTKK